ncbi:helix-turn-helix transcriptional regulator [Streptomyces sp. NPDC045470]|uniref:helix-turn-helix domain-containing protein n=1 Tax=Streptomyces sp. NPDC045470 TaxID=3155469 RepID=UPI0033FF4496
MPMETDEGQPKGNESLLAFFGNRLIKMRTERGWSQETTAAKALTNNAMISYIENAKRVPSFELAQDLDRALGTDFFAEFHPLVIKYAYPKWFLPFIELERDATSHRVFESQIIPGLLQTEDYARGMLSAVRPDNLEDLVAARMSRQAVFERETPPRTWFVFDEQVLRRPIGGTDAWRAQLEHLLKAGTTPRTVIQVVPSRVVSHPGLAGPFTVLSFAEGPDVLYVDGFSQGRMALDASEVADGCHAYDLLRASALSHEESADLIGSYLEGRTA